MIKLSKDDILRFQASLIDDFGGIHGIRDEGLLESAINAPFQSFDGRDLYPSSIAKIARLGYGLIQNHPFIDGNKRIGMYAIVLCFALNQIPFECDDVELRDEILHVADGTLNFRDFLLWICLHIGESRD